MIFHKKHQPLWLVLFVIGRYVPVSFLPWDFIRVSLAFSSIVVYNKSSECHCISREMLIKSQSQILQEFVLAFLK